MTCNDARIRHGAARVLSRVWRISTKLSPGSPSSGRAVSGHAEQGRDGFPDPGDMGADSRFCRRPAAQVTGGGTLIVPGLILA